MSYTIAYYKRGRKKRKVSKLTGEKIYSRSELEKGLWVAFSLYIRLRDKECVLKALGGCQGPLQAGHVIPRTKRATKYSEDNVFGQCAFHNKKHKWHPEQYELWYMQKFGSDKFMELKKRSLEPAKALNPKQLKDLTTHYAKKIEEL